MRNDSVSCQTGKSIIMVSAGINLIIISMLLMLTCTSLPAQVSANTIVKISPDGQHFTDRKGKPFFWQGDTEWELFHQFTVSEAKSLMLERRKQGFNILQVMVTGVYPEWATMTGTEPWKGSQAWLNNDPLTPNDDYFRRTDSIIAIAEQNDLILVIGVYHARDVDEGRITADNAKPWAEWLSKRYRNSHNIIWSMYPHAVAASIPVIEATVQGIREGDGGAHLITMHPDPSPASSSFMNSASWLSFNTLQTWSTGFSNYELVKADYDKTPVRPVVNGEARYEEEDGTSPFEARRAGYWACLAGGFYSYGHRDNWKSPPAWRNWYNTPGAKQITIMGNIFRSVKWWKLIPDQSLFVNQIKGNAAERSADGDLILAYLTNPDPVTINMDIFASLKTATATWIDPLTGNRTEIGSIPATGNHIFYPPKDWEDAVLLIEK